MCLVRLLAVHHRAVTVSDLEEDTAIHANPIIFLSTSMTPRY